MRAVCDPHLMLPLSGRAIAYPSRVSRLSSRAQRSIPGSARQRGPGTSLPSGARSATRGWCAADPGPKYPASEKGTAGVLGFRLSLRSAGMTTEETAPYAIALPARGRDGVGSLLQIYNSLPLH